MTKICYVDPTGASHVIDVAPGQSVMEGAINNMVPGIEAECGGACVCATCHVYVDDNFLPKLQPPNSTEAEMLDAVADDKLPNSRLSCQLKVSPSLEGLTVYLPSRQI